MPEEPTVQRAIAFIQDQYVVHAAHEAFGHSYPSYDPKKLAR